MPETDACFSTFEAYKQFTADRIDDIWRAEYYAEFAERLARGSGCCPELQAEALKYRPEQTDVQALQSFDIPAAIVPAGSPCLRHLYLRDTPAGATPLGKKWVEYRVGFSQQFWYNAYAKMAAKLHSCCLLHLNDCLQADLAHSIQILTPSAGAVESCDARWSPEHQSATFPDAAAPAPAAAAPAPDRSRCDAEIKGVVQKCTDDCAQLLREAKSAGAEEQAGAVEQAGKATARAGSLEQELRAAATRLELAQGSIARIAADRDRLQTELQAAVQAAQSRPGLQFLTAFPAGEGSGDFGLGAAAVLLGGFLLGLPGWRPWRRCSPCCFFAAASRCCRTRADRSCCWR